MLFSSYWPLPERVLPVVYSVGVITGIFTAPIDVWFWMKLVSPYTVFCFNIWLCSIPPGFAVIIDGEPLCPFGGE
jgi:hypothetical protein